MDRTAEKINAALDIVSRFLAKRDIPELTAYELNQHTGYTCVDALLAYGCDLTEVPELAAKAFHKNLCKRIVFSGGTGHGTEGLRKNAYTKYKMECADISEAEIMAEIAVRFLRVPNENVLIEKCSTNSGENARFSMNLLRQKGVEPKSILLLQDPMMQLRSHLSTLKVIPSGCILLSYAPFIPLSGQKRPWPDERFYDLVLREIPRINDDENGYGPRGLNFIEHCDIPEDVMQSYRYIKEATGL